MFLRLTRTLALAWVPLMLLSVIGCAGGPEGAETAPYGTDDIYEDDLGGLEDGQPEITPETVSEDMMLHRRTQVEPYIGVVMPVGHFEVGPMLGIKGQMEALKDVFWGISFDWVTQTVDERISDLGSSQELLSAEPDQFYDYVNRYNMLLFLDYDIPLMRDLGGKDKPLKLRLELGMGAAIVDGDEDETIAFSDIDIETYYGFLLRPAFDLRWQIWEHGLVSLGAGYDFVAPREIDVRLGGDEFLVDEDIDFGSFFIRGGFTFEF